MSVFTDREADVLVHLAHVVQTNQSKEGVFSRMMGV